MSNRFPCACPRARQIVGRKNWIGYAGGFAFPGFKANWVRTWQNNPPLYGYYYGAVTGGAWQFSADGGAITGSTANFAIGDLVLRENPPIGPLTDYLTGNVRNYPKFWNVYICTAAITGSATDPDTDTAHFQPWTWLENTTGAPSNGAGPSGWPMGTLGRTLGAYTTDTTHLEITVTTELDNFPLFPATMTGLIAKLGANNDTANSFSNTSVQETAAAATFPCDWTFPNNYDATTATYTPPSSSPSSPQSLLLFPSLPSQRVAGFAPTYNWSGGTPIMVSVFADAAPAWTEGTTPYPGLISWSFSATAIQFKFSAWSWTSNVTYNIGLGYFGSLASAPATVTQTITLGGAAYTQSDAIAQAGALRDAITFDSIPWRTSWRNTYDTSGAVVSTQNFASTIETAIEESGAVGAPVPWAVSVNGCPWEAGQTQFFSTKAQVDICGNYCIRTYACGTSGPTACANGNVDGYAPFTLAAPSAPGQSQAAYNAAQCS